jgi:hypothetical protein
MRRRTLAWALWSAGIASCGGGGGNGPTPANTAISVGGDYAVAVVLTENTCGGDVRVGTQPTRVEHTPGAAQFRLTHGLTYTGSLAADGAFTTDAQTVTDALGAQTVRLAGRFTRTGFDAVASVAVARPGGAACRYEVRWTAAKQGPANVIP